jgi:hypothetical protein
MADKNAVLLALISNGVTITPELVAALNGQAAPAAVATAPATPLTYAAVRAEREKLYPARPCATPGCTAMTRPGSRSKYCVVHAKEAFNRMKTIWAASKEESVKKAAYNAALWGRAVASGAKAPASPGLSTRIVIRGGGSFGYWVRKHLQGQATAGAYGGIEITVASEGLGKAIVDVLRKECVDASLVSVPK